MTVPIGADPWAWLDEHRSTSVGDAIADASPDLIEYSLADVVADRGPMRTSFERDVAAGWPAQAAATGAFTALAGAVAGLVVSATVTSDAAWLIDGDDVRWWIGSDGWPMSVGLGRPGVLVAPGHRWADHPQVETEPDADERVRRSLDALSTALAPLVEAARSCARLGRPGLWNAVVDSMATAVSCQTIVAPSDDLVDAARRLTDAPDQPWRSHPRLDLVDTELGPVCVAQRGGCCLLYTVDALDDDEPDDAHQRYEARFPEPAGSPAYCADCSLRSPADATERLTWWRLEELRESS